MSRRASKKKVSQKSRLFDRLRHQFGLSAEPAPSARRLQFENLEPRQLLTANHIAAVKVIDAAGIEFQANTFTAGNQQDPKVASDAAGDYVAVWQSYGQNGTGFDIYAQLYNASGATCGSEFLVNTATMGNQQNPSVAMDSNGDFVVAWETYGQDGSGYGIYAQQYNANGAAYGSQFQVNSYTTGVQQNPSVAMNSAGDFVVAWKSYNEDANYDYGIYAQRYNANGAASGSELQVNTATAGNRQDASVAMDSAGDFVVAWSGYGTNGYGIYAQQYTDTPLWEASLKSMPIRQANNSLPR